MTTSDAPQRSEAWFEARRGLPTCSRFDMILTPARGEPSKSQDTLINELIVESVLPHEQGVIRHVTPEMEYGIRLEAEARCFYELSVATEPVKEVGFILADSGLYGGSPDALVGDNGGVEIKVPSPATHVSYLRGGVLPAAYRLQVEGYLAVSGRQWWDFMSYSRHFEHFVVRTYRSEFTARLDHELIRFCEKYNEARARFGLPKIGRTAA